MNKLILPPPKPLSLPDNPTLLGETIANFLTKDLSNRSKRVMRTRIVRAFEAGIRAGCDDEKGVRIWTGSAYQEGGLSFRRLPVTTIMELMFVDVDDLRWIKDLGAKSVVYLNQQLGIFGLKIGMAVPPNDYD